MKYENKSAVVEAITFSELVEHGKAHPNTEVVEGMPQSFEYNNQPVAYENATTYLIANNGDTLRMISDDILIIPQDGKMFLLKKQDFEKVYSKA